MTERLPLRVRAAVDADVDYMMKSWLETYRRESSWAKRMPAQVYFENHRPLVTRLLRECSALIAASEADPRRILGFVCGERVRSILVLHFVYTRFAFRNFGVAKLLVEKLGWNGAEPIACSHWTHTADRLPNAYPLVYNPYLLIKHPRGDDDDDGDRAISG